MKQITSLIAWAAVALTAGLAVLNWPTLMASAPLNLVVAQVDAPLGVVLLGLAAVLVGLFFLAYLRNQISSLMETRKLLKEMQRVQSLADKAELSRIEALHQMVASEFGRLNVRLDTFAGGGGSNVINATDRSAEFKPYSLTEIVTGHEREP